MNSYQYQNPISITGTGNNNISTMATTINDAYPVNYMPSSSVKRATTIRAISIKEGYISSNIVTNTYFITPAGSNDYSLPVTCLTVPEEFLFDYEDGFCAPGKLFDEWRLANPGVTAYPWVANANWNKQDVNAWKVSLEYFEKNASSRKFQINAGYDVKGSASSGLSLKSLGLYFSNVYGSNTLGYPIFQAQGNTRTDFKHLVLRPTGSGFLFTDIINQAIVRHLNMDNQDASPTILFINGEYWGINDYRERYNKNYFEQIYGINKTELDIVRHSTSNIMAEAGTPDDLISLRNLVNTNTMTDANNWDYVNSKVDISNFKDYFITEIFLANYDWPSNNQKLFRKRVAPISNVINDHDGKYRWVLLDTEYQGYGDGNWIERCLRTDQTHPNDPGATVLFRNFMTNENFKRDFINRFADQLNTAFLPNYTNEIVSYYNDLLNPEIASHTNRWPDAISQADYTTKIADRRTFFVDRYTNCLNHIESTLSAGTQRTISLDVSAAAAGYIHINSIDLLPTTRGVSANPYPWTGKYFRNNKIKLEAKAKPGYVFSHWETNGLYNMSTNPTIEEYVQTSFNTAKAIFEVDNTPVCNAKLVQYWNFNTLQSGNVSTISPTITQVVGSAIILEGTGDGTMDRSSNTDGTLLNTQVNSLSGRGLRVKNPLQNQTLLIKTPSVGYTDLVFSYATMRSATGAEYQQVFYATNATQDNWTALSTKYVVPNSYEIKTFPITDTSAYNTANLVFKIVFSGDNTLAYSGNNRLDNMALHGKKIGIVDASICAGNTYAMNGQNFTQAGRYTFRINLANSCDSTTYLYLSVLAPSTAVITNTSGVLSIIELPSATYQWQDCNTNTPIAGATQSSFTPSANGVYSVNVYLNGCSSLSSCYTMNTVGITEISKEEIYIYPNPSSSSITLQSSATYLAQPYVLMDMAGRILVNGTVHNESTTIPIENIASGLYILQIKNKSLRLQIVK